MGGIVGGLFAAATGNWWALGAQLLGGVFGKPSGTRLDKKALVVQTAEEGEALPRGWGTWRQSGVMVWAPKLKERKKGSKLKGSRRWSYSTTFLVLGGRGPITRVNKIWFNQNLVYSWNGGNQKGFQIQVDPADGHFYGSKNGVGLRVYIGHPFQKVDPAIQAQKGANAWTGYPNQWGILVDGLELSEYGNALPTITAEVHYAVTGVAAIIREIGSWVGLEDSDWDLSAIEGLTVEGFVVDSRKSAAAAIESLMEAFHFALPEVDGVLRAVPLATAPVATLTSRDVRATSPGSETPAVVWEATQDKAIPQVVEVVTMDPARRYHPGYRYARRLSVDGRARQSVSYPLAMAANKAERLARVKVHEGQAQARTWELSRDLKHLWLAAGDCVTLDLPEGTVTVRLPEVTLPLFGPIAGTAREHDPVLYGAPIPPAEPTRPQQSVPDLGDLLVVAINSHVVTGATEEIEQAVTWLAVGSTGTSWRGAQVALNRPADTTLSGQQALTFPDRATIGTAVNTLGAAPMVPYGPAVTVAERKSIVANKVTAPAPLLLPSTPLGAGGGLSVAVDESAATFKAKLSTLPGYDTPGVTVTGGIQNVVPQNRATTPASATSPQATTTGHGAGSAADGNASTYWEPSRLGAEWRYDLGPNPPLVKAYAFVLGSGPRPAAWILYGSHDGQRWEGISNRANENLPGGRTLFELGLNQTAYRFYRIVFSHRTGANGAQVTDGTIQVHGIELMDALEGNNGRLDVTLGGALAGVDIGNWSISGTGWGASTTQQGGTQQATRADFDAWDEANTLRVKLPWGALFSASSSDVLAGANRAWLRNAAGEWEMIGWRTATFDAVASTAGEKFFDLSGLRRGQRSTWMHAAGHAIGDTFVLMDEAPQRIAWPGLNGDTSIGYTASHPDASASGTLPVTRANLRTIPPHTITGARATDGAWTITMVRRDRQSETWEDDEPGLPFSDGHPPQFVLSFQNESGAEVWSKIISGTQATLASAEHPVLNSDTLRVRARQVSGHSANVAGYWSDVATMESTP